MNNNKKKIKTSVVFLLGVPIVLLLFSILFLIKSEDPIIFTEVNPYISIMPLKYSIILDANYTREPINPEYEDSLSTTKPKRFIPYLLDENISRELLIFIASPIKTEITNDFNFKIYPKDISKLNGTKPFIEINFTNSAVIFNYQNEEFALFKLKIPLIDIEKIEIAQKIRNKKLSPWSATIISEFSDILYDVPEKKFNGNKATPNVYWPLLSEVLQQHGIKYVKRTYSVEKDTLYEIRKGMAAYLQESGSTVVTIKNSEHFWNSLQIKKTNLINDIEFDGPEATEAKALLNNYLHDNSDLHALFDLRKLAISTNIINVFTNQCTKEKLTFIYNNEKQNLEPLFNYSGCIGQPYKYVGRVAINDSEYIQEYKEISKDFSQINFTEEINKSETVINQIKLINSYYPSKIFDLDYLKINQLKILKNFEQSIVIKPELISINEERIILSVLNPSYYSINITGLYHKGKKEIVTLNPMRQLLSEQRDTIIMDLPQSFKNLFVSKKKRTTGFVFHKHIYDLKLSFELLGENKTQFADIIPYQENELVAEDLFSMKSAINNHEDLIVNNNSRIITFKKETVVISSPLIIPKGYQFLIKSGTHVNILNGGKIISYSPLKFNGRKNRPIKIFSEDKKGQGILVISASSESSIKHTSFSNLNNPKHGAWSVTGALTFYESPVNLWYVNIENNRCEDALNIIRTHFIMRHCEISNTQSDAFDGDFVKGEISNCSFNDLGNDAIDVSGSELTINNVVISYAGDKGLSAGEDSIMKISDVEISNSEIAVAGKDLSTVEVNGMKINDTKLGFTAFQKKPEFGPSNITVVNLELNNIETNFLIESSSSLIVDGKKIETSQNVKERMYGVEFGISSEATKKGQK